MKNQKKMTAIIILSAFMLVGCGSKADTQAIAELQSTVDDLQSQLDEYSALESELDSANKSIEEIQSQLEAITAEKDAMASKLEALYYIEAMDETMYVVISEAGIYDDLYDGLLENEASGTVSAEQEIKVTGKSNIIDWYEIDVDGTKKYINGSLISEQATEEQQRQTQQTQQTIETQQTTETQQQQQTQQTQQPAGDSEPDLNIGDVMGTDGGTGADMIYGGEVDISGFY